MTITMSKKFKQKDLIIRKIGIDYKKIMFSHAESFVVCESEEEYLNNKKDIEYYNNLKDKVDYILLHMDKNLSKVIYNEYLSSNSDNWWIYYYSKSTYYRMKNKAMDNFLEWWYA